MNNIVYLSPFSHLYKNGDTYTVEGELWFEPASDLNKNLAVSDWDTQDYFEIVSLLVSDQYNNVINSLEVEDVTCHENKYWLKVLIREFEVQQEFLSEANFEWGVECYED